MSLSFVNMACDVINPVNPSSKMLRITFGMSLSFVNPLCDVTNPNKLWTKCAKLSLKWIFLLLKLHCYNNAPKKFIYMEAYVLSCVSMIYQKKKSTNFYLESRNRYSLAKMKKSEKKVEFYEYDVDSRITFFNLATSFRFY